MKDVSNDEYVSAEVVKDKEGRQYHINLAPGELSEYIILVGDPQRSKKVAQHFDKILLHRENREFISYTGLVDGIKISVLSTGIGTDNIEIVVVEVSQIVENPTFIRVGSSGGLQEFTELGDLVISTGSVRLESTSNFFVVDGYPAIANFEVILALIDSAEELGYKYHVGLTATASGFYGAQGREVPGFHLRFPNLPEELRKMNVLNYEMETSALFILSQLRGFRVGAVCAIYANRPKNKFISKTEKAKAEERAIKTGILAIKKLYQMDKKKQERKKKYWSPSLSI
ncbi:MAG: nucleoside phosphorylase [Candidatus Asgardarchaeia archaeon]